MSSLMNALVKSELVVELGDGRSYRANGFAVIACAVTLGQLIISG